MRTAAVAGNGPGVAGAPDPGPALAPGPALDEHEQPQDQEAADAGEAGGGQVDGLLPHRRG
jgi:hypothetical protein